MPTSLRSTPGRKKPQPSGAISALERSAAARIVTLLSSGSAKDRGAVQVVDVHGHRIDLPIRLTDIVVRAARLLAGGQSVAVLPDEELLSTQAAADLLNISRQYLVRLVDAGDVPAIKVGSHRRLRAGDVAAYKISREARRDSALDRLTELSEEAGGYALGTTPR